MGTYWDDFAKENEQKILYFWTPRQMLEEFYYYLQRNGVIH